MTELNFTHWRKSTRSSGGGNCVEVALDNDTAVGVRDSKDRNGGTLVVPRSAWLAFIDGATEGQFGRP